MMLESATNPLDQLEIIDALQRLGVAYHFEDQIETKLKSIYNDIINKQRLKQDPPLYATALEFRLLRKHGYNVPQGDLSVITNLINDDKQAKNY